jgi:hypothetical protein
MEWRYAPEGIQEIDHINTFSHVLAPISPKKETPTIVLLEAMHEKPKKKSKNRRQR